VCFSEKLNSTQRGLCYFANFVKMVCYDAGDVHLLVPADVNMGGRPLNFLDDLDIDGDGSIYFTDASRFPRRDFMRDLLDGRGTGRLESVCNNSANYSVSAVIRALVIRHCRLGDSVPTVFLVHGDDNMVAACCVQVRNTVIVRQDTPLKLEGKEVVYR